MARPMPRAAPVTIAVRSKSLLHMGYPHHSATCPSAATASIADGLRVSCSPWGSSFFHHRQECLCHRVDEFGGINVRLYLCDGDRRSEVSFERVDEGLVALRVPMGATLSIGEGEPFQWNENLGRPLCPVQFLGHDFPYLPKFLRGETNQGQARIVDDELPGSPFRGKISQGSENDVVNTPGSHDLRDPDRACPFQPVSPYGGVKPVDKTVSDLVEVQIKHAPEGPFPDHVLHGDSAS